MLVNLKEILKSENRGKIAIGAFNTPNLESVTAVIAAAEELNVPVIISHAQLHEEVVPLDIIGRVMAQMAERSSVKVCVHLDHGEDILYIKRAIDLGFTSVMFDGSTLSYEENVLRTKEVCDYAHRFGVSVEAELGRLKGREGGGGEEPGDNGEYTDPELVPDFIARTGIDALAIAFGTAHGLYDKPPVLNFDIITKVAAKTDVPLVMHGGSGIDSNGYRQAIENGIMKINYYTYMAYDGYDAVKSYIEKKPRGFYHELAAAATEAEKATAGRILKTFANLEEKTN